MLSFCLCRFIPWNENKAALTQSHPGWDEGGDGLRGSWEDFQQASPVLQVCQELKVPRAPEGLQVGMLVWNSPGDVSMASGSTESSAEEKPWKGNSYSRLLQLLGSLRAQRNFLDLQE